jgi:hypothetical protein
MSKEQDRGRESSPWAGTQHPSSTPPPSGLSPDPGSSKIQYISSQLAAQSRPPPFSPSNNPICSPDRPKLPTRSSTLGNSEPDHSLSVHSSIPYSRSEDLSHGSSSFQPSSFTGSSPRPSPAFLTPAGGSSRPTTPAGSQMPQRPSSSGHSDDSEHRQSVASFSSTRSGSSSQSGVGKPPPTTTSATSASLSLT